MVWGEGSGNIGSFEGFVVFMEMYWERGGVEGIWSEVGKMVCIKGVFFLKRKIFENGVFVLLCVDFVLNLRRKELFRFLLLFS